MVEPPFSAAAERCEAEISVFPRDFFRTIRADPSEWRPLRTKHERPERRRNVQSGPGEKRNFVDTERFASLSSTGALDISRNDSSREKERETRGGLMHNEL